MMTNLTPLIERALNELFVDWLILHDFNEPEVKQALTCLVNEVLEAAAREMNPMLRNTISRSEAATIIRAMKIEEET